MPSAYTARITSTTTLAEFAMLCARAFGATIAMRDEPLDAPIPERFEPHDYHKRRVAEIDEQAENIRAMTPEEAEQTANEDRAGRAEQARLRREADETTRANYTRVLDQVTAWAPPKELENLRAYMIQQIKDGLRFDCPEEPPSTPGSGENAVESGEVWRARMLGRLADDRLYHANAYDEEVRRTEERNAWLALLRESLPAVPHA